MGFIPENVIVNLKKEIAASGGAAIEALTTRVQTLESTVGDETSGLVKDVDDLETTVGDSSAGLVKDVTDLQTTVGDNSSGLVKDVGELKTVTTISDYFGTLPQNVSVISSLIQKCNNIITLNVIIRKSDKWSTSIINIPVKAAYMPQSNINSYGISKNDVYADTDFSPAYLFLNVNYNILSVKCFNETDEYIAVSLSYCLAPTPPSQQTREDDQEENVLK